MAKINLLPWRQELRKQRQQEFIAIVMAVAVVAVAIILFGHVALSKQVGDQEERNQYIRAELAKLDTQIQEIDELQRRREELLARMKVIQDLQGRRPVIVRIFDELVRIMPDGVYITSLDRKGDSFTLSGVAETAGQVSNLMRNFDASPWFKDPRLFTVAAEQGRQSSAAEQRANKFSLRVQLEMGEIAASVDEKQEAAK
ncbi:MAG: PilN domain-containing protein [Pseudomonadota bacterium]